MSCTEYSERVALLAGGDLPEDERPEMERHLAGCAECRELAAELGVLRETMAGMAEEPMPRPDVPIPAAPGWRWRWVAAAAAALVVVAGTWMLQPKREVATAVEPAVEETVARSTAPAPPTPVVEPEPEPEPEPVVAREPVREPAQEPVQMASNKTVEPMVVKFLTDDPEVVIYWIVEGRGE